MIATVYARSNSTVLGVVAGDGTNSCFLPRIPNMTRHVVWFNAKGTVGMYSTDDTYLYSGKISWDAGVEKSPLSRRSWVSQECAILFRTPRFGISQITGNVGKCEAFPDVIQWWKATTNGSRESKAAIDRNEPWNWWKSVVSEYSRMSLRKKDDILWRVPPLQAATSQPLEIKSSPDSEEQLWKRNRTWRLTCDDSAKELPVAKALRPVRYTAPTWS